MALPIVSGSEVNTPSSGVPINGESFRQAALAPGKLAEAIGQDVGGVFQDVSNKIQDARNAKAIFQADLQMRQAKDQFTQDISKDPNLAKDPGTWVPEWQKRSKETQDQILNQPNLAPIVKKQLTRVTGIWGMDATSEIRNNALKRDLADTEEAGMATAGTALASGDPAQLPQAIAAYKSLNELGIHGPKYTDALIKNAPIVMADAQANHIINTNPEEAPRLIQDQLGKTLPPKKLETILKTADQRQAFAQNQNAQNIKGDIFSDSTHNVDAGMLRGKLDGSKISKEQYDQIQVYSKRLRADDKKDLNAQELGEFNIAKGLADSPPPDPTTLDTWATHIKNMGLSWTNQAYTNHLNEYVNNRVDQIKKTGDAHERPIEQFAYDLAKHDPLNHDQQTISELTRKDSQGKYQLSQKGFNKRYPGQDRDTMVQDAQRKYAAKVDSLRTWLSDPNNEKATREQVTEAWQKINEPDVMAKVKKSIDTDPGTGLPESDFDHSEDDVKQEDYAKLKSGDKYWWKGKELTKK